MHNGKCNWRVYKFQPQTWCCGQYTLLGKHLSITFPRPPLVQLMLDKNLYQICKIAKDFLAFFFPLILRIAFLPLNHLWKTWLELRPSISSFFYPTALQSWLRYAVENIRQNILLFIMIFFYHFEFNIESHALSTRDSGW